MNAPLTEPLPPEEPLEVEDPLAHLHVVTDLSLCVTPLLRALKWEGPPRDVAESVPHFIDDLDITSFQNIFANLGYKSHRLEMKLKDLDDRLLPCLFLPKNGDAMVVEKLTDDGKRLEIFDGGLDARKTIAPGALSGLVCLFIPEEQTAGPKSKDPNWVRDVGERFRGLLYQALGVTLALNILALAIPLFVMGVYDRVVATESLSTLNFFVMGVFLAIVSDALLRRLRAQKMAFIGARFDTIVGNAIFQKILSLPPSFSEGATTGSQVARIKDFETIREFFTGPLAMVLVELPFVVIFIAVIGHLGGPVALVPLIMLALFALSGFILTPIAKKLGGKASQAGSKGQEFLIEALTTMRALKYSATEQVWIDRYREISAEAALASFRASQASGLNRALANLFMQASGLATIAFGVFRVLEGEMSIGGLVASMILVWRVLSPLQTGFVSLSRINSVRSSIEQINNLMKIPSERSSGLNSIQVKRAKGSVAFSRVSLRYSPEADPALLGVTFAVDPGEIVGIIGPNGSGKSTIIKILVGMVAPQAGSILIDNMDIRQMDPSELRQQIGYAPQISQFFYGTIAQNMRLAHPTASDEALREAARKADCLKDIEALEQGSGKWKRTGFEFRIGDSGSAQLPASLLQRLNLARAYLKNASIMLFDEPGSSLDFEGDQALIRMLKAFKGNTTCFLVTYRPSHLRLCDKIILLDHGGRIRAFGPGAEVLKLMSKKAA